MNTTPTRPEEKDLLSLFYLENARQARHYEEQRQSLSNAVMVAASIAVAGACVAGSVASAGSAASVAAATSDPATLPSAMLVGALLILLGGFGFLASLRNHERSRLHVERLHAVRDEIERRLPIDLDGLYEAARKRHARRYPRLSERTARVHYVWQGLHAGIAGLGAILIVRSIG